MSSKGTPKKLYSSTKTTFDLSSCRLCGNVVDAYYCKNIFKPENRDSLNVAEALFGSTIVQHEQLPRLMCRLCERRLKNFQSFKVVVTDTQKSYHVTLRTKRCKDVSPSTLRPPPKACNTTDSRHGTTTARSLVFDSLRSSEGVIPHRFVNIGLIIQGESKKTDTFDIQMNNKGVSFF